MAIPIDPRPGDAVFLPNPQGRWGLFQFFAPGQAGFGDTHFTFAGNTPAVAREALTPALVAIIGKAWDGPAEAFAALIAADPRLVERNEAAALARAGGEA